jgi:DNA processing protein
MDISKKEKQFRFGLGRIKGIGAKRYLEILKVFGSAENFWNSSSKDIVEIFGQNIGTKIVGGRDAIVIKGELAKLEEANIKYVVLGQSDYPKLLSEISDPPICLYWCGVEDFSILENAITIVGTRTNTSYGEQFLKTVVPEFTKRGITIISGMAFGIDKIAHNLTLKNAGQTVAVLASSPDKPTPTAHTTLYKNILDSSGLVLSEYYPDTKVASGNFPMRNRILAGLSQATLVVEAPRRSGALITAHLAFDYGREVFALPGDINSNASEGCNHLIKIQRAKLIENAQDILIELGYQENIQVNKMNFEKYNELSDYEKKLVDTIRTGYFSIEELKQKFDTDTSSLIASLMELEVKGYIFKKDNGEYGVSM